MARKNALRDLIKGNSRVEYSWITSQMATLRERCPRVYGPLIPLSLDDKEKLFAAGATDGLDQSYNSRDLTYDGDDLGDFVRPTYGATIKPSMRTSSHVISHLPTTAQEDPSFFAKLKRAYERDYKKPLHMSSFARPMLRYVARARATLRSTERHCAFAPGRWVHLKDGTIREPVTRSLPYSFQSTSVIVQIQSVFVHERVDEKRVFMVVSKARFLRHDNDLDTDVYTMRNDTVKERDYDIIGLSCIKTDQATSPFLHMMPILTARTLPSKDGGAEANVVAMEPVVVSDSPLYWLNPRVTKFL